MSQRLHGSARTTEAVRRAIPQRQQSIGVLAERHGITPKPVAQWQTRPFGLGAQGTDGWPVHDLNPAAEATVVACRQQTLLPLEAGLSALATPSAPNPRVSTPRLAKTSPQPSAGHGR
jgi:hypothetical protein